MKNILNDVDEANEQRPLSRRNALRNAGLMLGSAVVGGSFLSRAGAQTSAGQPSRGDILTQPPVGTVDGEGMSMARAAFGDLVMPRTDVEILNFALILEYLEADYYARAIAAHERRPYLKRRVPEIATKLRDDENAHVVAIQERIRELGAAPVARPQFQFPAETFISEVAFLDLAATFEQNGVGAYLDAAPKLKSGPVLRFAASIYGVEARHTSMIRMASGRLAAPSALETPLSALEVATRSAPFILPSAM
ncbi:MAG TPA: ferritin-like domain-containing protein [Abditibacteriaceae bacterium]|jgi:hypothetical protein